MIMLQAGAAHAACVGVNMIEELPPADRAEISAIAEADQFGAGNMWRATRGDDVVHLIGTIHLFDGRNRHVVNGLTPVLSEADLVMLELNREGMTAIQAAPTQDPDRFFIRQGDTLPALLGPEKWEELKSALEARGLPGFVAAQFQPWYVALVLASPPCMLADQALGRGGLDHMILETAEALDIPTRSLDRPDDVLALFEEGELQDHLDAIDVALMQLNRADDLAATTIKAYFDQAHRLVWEFNRLTLEQNEAFSEEEKAEMLAELEEKLLVQRNQSWIDQIEAATADFDRIVVAVGALHLSTDHGLARLLAERGFRLERAGHDLWGG